MKLILATDDQQQFAATWDLLQAHGIPVHEPSKYSDMSGYRVGPSVRSLYIWLDHQFDDAVSLLQDPNYIVKNPVDWDEFERIQASVDAEVVEVREKTHESLMNWVIGVVVAGLAAFGVYRVWFWQ